MIKSNRISITFSSLAQNVTIARILASTLGAQLDFPVNELEEIKVAVSEAVSNSIIHGYGNDPDKLVTLELEVTEDNLVIQVIDNGCGIQDIKQAMQASYSTDPERMGLGFIFMQSFMDDLQVESTPDKGTKVTMLKRINRNHPTSH